MPSFHTMCDSCFIAPTLRGARANHYIVATTVETWDQGGVRSLTYLFALGDDKRRIHREVPRSQDDHGARREKSDRARNRARSHGDGPSPRHRNVRRATTARGTARVIGSGGGGEDLRPRDG